jgi:hypothetical protein
LADPLPHVQQQLFLQMQQLMAEQFQQAMSLFVEAFWGMHREQSRLVRRELKRIQRLTQELAALEGRLGQPPPAGPLATAPSPGRRELPDGANTGGGLGTSVSATGPTSSPGPPPRPKKPRPSAPPGPIPVEQSPADLHAWLSRRVAEIQQERQGSWQRIRNLIQGVAPGEKPGPSGSPPRAKG